MSTQQFIVYEDGVCRTCAAVMASARRGQKEVYEVRSGCSHESRMCTDNDINGKAGAVMIDTVHVHPLQLVTLP